MRRFMLKLIRRRRLHRDLEAELAFHREMSVAHHNPIPLGNAAVIGERALDLWRFNFIENLWRDLVYAARGLRRSPSLVIGALVSLGLGIGVNTAMFSLGAEFLFSQPSVNDAGSLVSLRVGGNSHAQSAIVARVRLSRLFADVAGENEEVFSNFNDGSETHRIFGIHITKNYFNALGVPVLYGRGILPSDPDAVVVLRYQFWRKYFNGDPSIVGRNINLDGRLCTVVGITPEHHRTPLGFGYSPDVYMPVWLPDTVLAMYARLRPGMSIGEARAGLATVAARIDATTPGEHPYARGIRVSPIGGYARLATEKDMQTVGVFFAILLIIVALVLLIACVNVASLLLARASARRSEMATRLALGAGRGRLLQQFLTESVLLSLLGVLCGLALSQITATLLAGIRLPLPLPVRLQIQLDWRVILYAAILGGAATFACGLLPALRSVRESIAPNLARDNRMRLRRVLVSAQIAVSVVVLTTGFLFLRNLMQANSISPGFDVRHTLRADVSLPATGYEGSRRKALYADRVLRELGAIPGIESVAAAQIVPFTDNTSFGMDIQFPDNGQKVRTYFRWNAVTAAFFRTMDIPFLKGATFGPVGGNDKVAIVNRTFVQRYLGGRQPVGAVFLWGKDGETPFRIVGVVEGTKTITIGEEQQAQLYEPLGQVENDRRRIQFVMRSSIPPALQLDTVRKTLHRIEPMAGAQVETLYASVGLAFLPSQIGAALLGSIGMLGVLLAAIGLYGVMVYSVARRTREIGLRIAIGATRRDIARLFLHDAARVTAYGSALGLAAAIFVTRPLAMFLVPGLKSTDPINYAAVLFVMFAVALFSATFPLRKASRIDPNAALRWE